MMKFFSKYYMIVIGILELKFEILMVDMIFKFDDILVVDNV